MTEVTKDDLDDLDVFAPPDPIPGQAFLDDDGKVKEVKEPLKPKPAPPVANSRSSDEDAAGRTYHVLEEVTLAELLEKIAGDIKLPGELLDRLPNERVFIPSAAREFRNGDVAREDVAAELDRECRLVAVPDRYFKVESWEFEVKRSLKRA